MTTMINNNIQDFFNKSLHRFNSSGILLFVVETEATYSTFTWLIGQAVKTPVFHTGIQGSTP